MPIKGSYNFPGACTFYLDTTNVSQSSLRILSTGGATGLTDQQLAALETAARNELQNVSIGVNIKPVAGSPPELTIEGAQSVIEHITGVLIDKGISTPAGTLNYWSLPVADGAKRAFQLTQASAVSTAAAQVTAPPPAVAVQTPSYGTCALGPQQNHHFTVMPSGNNTRLTVQTPDQGLYQILEQEARDFIRNGHSKVTLRTPVTAIGPSLDVIGSPGDINILIDDLLNCGYYSVPQYFSSPDITKAYAALKTGSGSLMSVAAAMAQGGASGISMASSPLGSCAIGSHQFKVTNQGTNLRLEMTTPDLPLWLLMAQLVKQTGTSSLSYSCSGTSSPQSQHHFEITGSARDVTKLADDFFAAGRTNTPVYFSKQDVTNAKAALGLSGQAAGASATAAPAASTKKTTPTEYEFPEKNGHKLKIVRTMIENSSDNSQLITLMITGIPDLAIFNSIQTTIHNEGVASVTLSSTKPYKLVATYTLDEEKSHILPDIVTALEKDHGFDHKKANEACAAFGIEPVKNFQDYNEDSLAAFDNQLKGVGLQKPHLDALEAATAITDLEAIRYDIQNGVLNGIHRMTAVPSFTKNNPVFTAYVEDVAKKSASVAAAGQQESFETRHQQFMTTHSRTLGAIKLVDVFNRFTGTQDFDSWEASLKQQGGMARLALENPTVKDYVQEVVRPSR